MAKQPEPPGRVPSALGGLPIVGGLARSADAQARWMRELIEQNARLLAQLPDTVRSFNDALERFNQTVARLDRTVARIEATSRTLGGPIEKVAGALDPKTLRDLPETLDTLRREAVPAMRAAADTQRQVARLQTTVDRILALIGELPGGGLVRRLTGPRPDGTVSSAPPVPSVPDTTPPPA